MNHGELKALIATYMHRTDLATVIPRFIELAETRIGHELRAREMEFEDTVTMTSNPQRLIPEWVDLRGVTLQHHSTAIALTRRPWSNLEALTKTGAPGPARWYATVGQSLYTTPWLVDQQVRLFGYVQPPALDADADTNAVLTEHPQLYLYGALVEGFFYERAFDARQGALDTFNTEVAVINAEAATAMWSQLEAVPG